MTQLLDEYVYENKFTSIKWQVFQHKFESFVDAHFSDEDEARWIKSMINWQQWVYGPGLAPVWTDWRMNFTTPLLLES